MHGIEVNLKQSVTMIAVPDLRKAPFLSCICKLVITAALLMWFNSKVANEFSIRSGWVYPAPGIIKPQTNQPQKWYKIHCFNHSLKLKMSSSKLSVENKIQEPSVIQSWKHTGNNPK